MADKKRHIDEEYPGMPTNNPEKYPERAKRRNEFTEKFRRYLEDYLGYDETQVEKYLYELRQELGDQTKKIKQINKDIKDLDINRDQGSVGHRHPVSKTINSPANRQLEPKGPNVAKKDNYSISPEAQLAVGNPAHPKRSFFDNWKNDFLVWADRKENGGSGILPQHRRTYRPRIEQELYRLGGGPKGESYDDLSPAEQLKVRERVDDLTARLDDPMRPAHETGTKYERRWVNPVSPDDIATAADAGPPTPKVTELGKGLGGVFSKINIGGNLRRADTLAQLGISASQGDALGMTIQGTQLAAGEALQTRAVQTRLAKKIAELSAKRAGKTGLKLIPGVGLALSGAESYGYAQQGKWDQAIVSGVSGIVGELPGFGDALSAGLDIWNTSQDISDLHSAAQQELDRLNSTKPFRN